MMRRIGNLFILLIVSVSFLLVCPPVDGRENIHLTVVYTDWFPYTYRENGQARGFELEIFKTVIAQMGITADYTRYPWKRCLAAIKNGSADVLISLLKTSERETFTYYPQEPISISKTVFFTRADSAIRYSGSLQDLENYRIGFILGFSYGEAFDRADYLKKDSALTHRVLIKKLLVGRNDLVAENQTVIERYAKQMGVRERIRVLKPPIHHQKLYAGFSRAGGWQQLCDDFSKALAAFKQSEMYKGMLRAEGVFSSQYVVKPE